MGTHGVARDGHGLNDGVGVALQHRPVHEGAGVALVGVTADVLDAVRAYRVVGELPLQAGGETGAAPAPETGGLYYVDDLLGRDLLRKDLAQGGVAVHTDVLVDALRVDDAAVAQSDALLVLIELGLGQRGDRALLGHIPVEQAFDDAALHNVLGDDLLHVVHGNVGVAGPFRVDRDNGTQGTQAETAGAYHSGLLVHTLGHQLLFKFRNDLLTVGRGAAGAGADQDVGTDKTHLFTLPYSAAPMVYSSTTRPLTRCSLTMEATFSGVIFT